MTTKINTCVACGTNRKRKQLAYTEDYIPYCSSYWICNDNHPHHPNKKEQLQLFSLKEIQNKLIEKVGVDSPYIKQLRLKPFSIRISDYKTLSFLMDIKKANNFDSISDCLRYCIDFTMNDHYKELEQPKTKTTDEELKF